MSKYVGSVEGVGKATGVIAEFVSIYASALGGFHFEITGEFKCCVLQECCHPLYGYIVRNNWESDKISTPMRYPQEGELDASAEDGGTVIDIYLAHRKKAAQEFVKEVIKRCTANYLKGVRTCWLKKWAI